MRYMHLRWYNKNDAELLSSDPERPVNHIDQNVPLIQCNVFNMCKY